MMRQFEQSTQDSVQSAETNSLCWVDTRKSPANWDLLGGGLERNGGLGLSGVQAWPGPSSQVPRYDNVRIMSGKTVPAADFPPIHPTSGSR